jgi:membrane peptidoglycan carboxypeptidase
MGKVTGGGLPAKLWRNIMIQAHEGLPVRSLPGLIRTESVPIAKQKIQKQDQGFWAQLMSGLTGDDS